MCMQADTRPRVHCLTDLDWCPLHNNRYSERLLLVPGLGIVFDGQLPVPRASGPLPLPASGPGSRIEAPPPGTLIINCAWSPPKINVESVVTLRRIVMRVQERHR